VQDAGLPLNRTAVESQINGGMIQALGMAFYEGRVMDEKLGIMLNPEFGSYKLPGCLEMPELVPLIDDGDKRPQVIGIAESTNVAGVGALANAVYNACGVRVRDLPITPDKILMGLQALKGQTA
jgi:xanthine dehydrogenase YagR molybdenum-binding subunit